MCCPYLATRNDRCVFKFLDMLRFCFPHQFWQQGRKDFLQHVAFPYQALELEGKQICLALHRLLAQATLGVFS